MMKLLLLGFLSMAVAGPATETYKNQYCTDPRTMHKHEAYTEWADAYSCTRHRCQPGGRNLAIYTVGCKRVEAPESAIECEEVVEDTNMQFPFCCTRLRCLVVVRGEVWTRVLGQPWEALPAAPWSHMYKMKKPPPADGTFLPKSPDQGPIYELTDGENHGGSEKVLRASKSSATEGPDCNDAVPRAVGHKPDIVIALSTNADKDSKSLIETDFSLGRHKKVRKTMPSMNSFFEEDRERERAEEGQDGDRDSDGIASTVPPEASEESRFYGNSFGVTPKGPPVKSREHHQVGWTEIPQNQWNERDPTIDADTNKDVPYQEPQDTEVPRVTKPSNLQALVDAIGSRMKDIESVVQRMSAKVHHDKPGDEDRITEDEGSHKHQKIDNEYEKTKRPGPDDTYKRFSVRNRGSKYLHTADSTTDQPLFLEDAAATGYFSDASNGMLRRINGPKEPAQTYMAPVETRRKSPSDLSDDETQKKHKKHKKKKGKHHKKHHGKKKFNRLTSSETDKNVVSLEDSSNVASS